jgi:Saxitoxin biosynthesis operon protein SxtJ
MAFACFFIAAVGWLAGTSHWPYWSAAAIAFGLTAWLKPALLTQLNRLWFRFGLLLHRIVNPLVMGLLFFVIITPMGLLMRLSGNRPLELKFQPGAPSYWIVRNNRERPPGSMAKQY